MRKKSAKIHFLIGQLYLKMINFTPNFAWNKSHFIYERSKFEILRTPENITDDAVPETFIHLSQKTENMIPCYFPSELSKLNYKDLYFDGTFSMVRNLDLNQIYIISIVYTAWVWSGEVVCAEMKTLLCNQTQINRGWYCHNEVS